MRLMRHGRVQVHVPHRVRVWGDGCQVGLAVRPRKCLSVPRLRLPERAEGKVGLGAIRPATVTHIGPIP